MTDVFLCGALAHAPLLRIIAQSATPVPARLPGYAPVPVAGGDLTALRPDPWSEAVGLRLSCQPDLESYLAVYGLSLTAIGDLLVVLAPQAVGQWDEASWSAERRVAVLRAAEEIAAHLPGMGAQKLAARLTSIRMRAALWAKARALPPQPQSNQTFGRAYDIDRDVRVARIHRPYLNFFAVEEMDLRFRKQDGAFSDEVNRGALMIGEAAAVLPYDPLRDEVLLIQQFRAPLYMGGARDPWVWEPVAGLVEPGETPEQTAHREALEEAGLKLRHLVPLGPTHGSPGALSDRLNLFVGLTDLRQVAQAAGVASEGEDIRSEILPWQTFLARLDAQAYPILPLVTLGLWLARHRARLRAMA